MMVVRRKGSTNSSSRLWACEDITREGVPACLSWETFNQCALTEPFAFPSYERTSNTPNKQQHYIAHSFFQAWKMAYSVLRYLNGGGWGVLLFSFLYHLLTLTRGAGDHFRGGVGHKSWNLLLNFVKANRRENS